MFIRDTFWLDSWQSAGKRQKCKHDSSFPGGVQDLSRPWRHSQLRDPTSEANGTQQELWRFSRTTFSNKTKQKNKQEPCRQLVCIFCYVCNSPHRQQRALNIPAILLKQMKRWSQAWFVSLTPSLLSRKNDFHGRNFRKTLSFYKNVVFPAHALSVSARAVPQASGLGSVSAYQSLFSNQGQYVGRFPAWS